MPTRLMPARCDPKKLQAVAYEKLDPIFFKLSKPAQRALLSAKIHAPRDLAKWAVTDILTLHGIGPMAIPVLKAALRKANLAFKKG